MSVPGVIAALVLGLAGLLPGPAAASTDGCADGVTVVVDFTDVGGGVEVGCAAGDPSSGREALEQAGFTATDSVPGMICAVDSRPDPCPEEFDGSFWSYWAGEGEEWTAHLEGADSVDPAPGDVEGWRYNDGTTGPGVSPAGPLPGADAPAPTSTTDEPLSSPAADTAAEPVDSPADGGTDGGVPTAVWWGVGAAAALVVGLLLLRARRD